MTGFNRFDIVQILTTKNVTWVSADSPKDLSPKGLWSIVQMYEDDEVLICREKDLVRIPKDDLKTVKTYNLTAAVNQLLTKGPPV